MKGDNLVLEVLIPDETRAMDIFREIRWSNGVYCPKCMSFNIYNRGFQGKTKRYSCKNCGLNFSDLTGTIFAKKRISMGEIFYILINLDKKSIKHLSEELGRKWDTVYAIAQNFRRLVDEKSEDTILSREIEMDEMYHSSGSKGLKKQPAEKRG